MKQLFGFLIASQLVTSVAWSNDTHLNCQMTVFEGSGQESTEIYSAALEGPEKYAAVRFESMDHRIESIAWDGGVRFVTITQISTSIGASSSSKSNAVRALSVVLNQWPKENLMRQNLVHCFLN